MITCQRCGATNQPTNKFCLSCGSPIAQAAPPPAAPGGWGPPQAQPPGGPPGWGAPAGAPPQAQGWGPPQPGYGPPQGMPPQGMPPQGMPPQGMPPQGMPPQGMMPQGMPPQGMPPQGMMPGGPPPGMPAPAAGWGPPQPGYGPPPGQPAAGWGPPQPASPYGAPQPPPGAPPQRVGQPQEGLNPFGNTVSPDPAALAQAATDPNAFAATAPPPTADEFMRQQQMIAAGQAAQAPMPMTAAPPPPVIAPAPPAPTGGGVEPDQVPAGAPRVLVGFLVSFEDDELGKFWPLHQGQNLVGRKDAADGLHVAIDHPTTSSRHAVVYASAKPGRVKIEDTGSTNGSFYREEKLQPGTRVELRDGEVIRFGGFSATIKLI